MSTTTVIDTHEVQHVLHAAIAERAAHIADSPVSPGTVEIPFDVLDATGELMRACKAIDIVGNLGEPHSPPDFYEMNLRTPRVFDALRAIVAEWVGWCETHLADPIDLTAAFGVYWTGEAEAAARVLALIDGEEALRRLRQPELGGS